MNLWWANLLAYKYGKITDFQFDYVYLCPGPAQDLIPPKKSE